MPSPLLDLISSAQQAPDLAPDPHPVPTNAAVASGAYARGQAQQDRDAAAQDQEDARQSRAYAGQQRSVLQGLVSRGIPSYVDQEGVKPVTDETGAPLTNHDPQHNIAWDSTGSPRSISYDSPDGPPKLKDPFENAQSLTDPNDGSRYKVAAGLPWQYAGQDPDIAAAAQVRGRDKALSAASTALGRQLSQDEHLSVAGEHDFNFQQKQLAQTVPELSDPDVAQDPDAAMKAIHGHFDAALQDPQATQKTGWFTSTLSPEASAYRQQVEQQRQATVGRYQGLAQQRQQLDALNDRINARRAVASQMDGEVAQHALMRIPGLEDSGGEQNGSAPQDAQSGPPSLSPNPVSDSSPNPAATDTRPQDQTPKAYTVAPDGVHFTHGSITAGMQQAAADGRISPPKPEDLAAAQKADADYQTILKAAGGNSKLKAFIDSGLKSYGAMAAGGAASAAVGAFDPELAGAGAMLGGVGAVALPLIVHGIAFLGGAALGHHLANGLASKIAQYSDTVKSLEASTQLPENQGAVALGNLAGMAPAAIGSIANVGRAAAIAGGAAADAGGSALGAAAKLVARHAGAGAVAGAGFEATLRPAFDWALDQGRFALGMEKEGVQAPTVGSIAENAILGSILSGEGMKIKGYDTAAVTDIVQRGRAAEAKGVPLSDHLSAGEQDVYRAVGEKLASMAQNGEQLIADPSKFKVQVDQAMPQGDRAAGKEATAKAYRDLEAKRTPAQQDIVQRVDGGASFEDAAKDLGMKPEDVQSEYQKATQLPGVTEAMRVQMEGVNPQRAKMGGTGEGEAPQGEKPVKGREVSANTPAEPAQPPQPETPPEGSGQIPSPSPAQGGAAPAIPGLDPTQSTPAPTEAPKGRIPGLSPQAEDTGASATGASQGIQGNSSEPSSTPQNVDRGATVSSGSATPESQSQGSRPAVSASKSQSAGEQSPPKSQGASSSPVSTTPEPTSATPEQQAIIDKPTTTSTLPTGEQISYRHNDDGTHSWVSTAPDGKVTASGAAMSPELANETARASLKLVSASSRSAPAGRTAPAAAPADQPSTGNSSAPAYDEAAATSHSRAAFYKLDPDEKDLLQGRLSAMLSKRGAIWFSDIPTELQNKIGTSETASLKRALVAHPKAVIDALGDSPAATAPTNQTASDITKALTGMSGGFTAAAKQHLADQAAKGQPESLTKPRAIELARKDQDLQLRDNADGSVTVMGVNSLAKTGTAPVTFETSKGSTYVVNKDGTTTRNKAARPEHPGDSGPMAPSEKTFYITREQGQALASPQGSSRIFVSDDGKLTSVWKNNQGKWGTWESAQNIVPSTQPKAGLYPLELWHSDDIGAKGGTAYKTIHFGNEIAKVSHAAPAPEQPRKYDDLPSPTKAQMDLMDDRATSRTPVGQVNTIFVRPGAGGHEWVAQHGAKIAGSGVETDALAAKKAGRIALNDFIKTKPNEPATSPAKPTEPSQGATVGQAPKAQGKTAPESPAKAADESAPSTRAPGDGAAGGDNEPRGDSGHVDVDRAIKVNIAAKAAYDRLVKSHGGPGYLAANTFSGSRESKVYRAYTDSSRAVREAVEKAGIALPRIWGDHASRGHEWQDLDKVTSVDDLARSLSDAWASQNRNMHLESISGLTTGGGFIPDAPAADVVKTSQSLFERYKEKGLSAFLEVQKAFDAAVGRDKKIHAERFPEESKDGAQHTPESAKAAFKEVLGDKAKMLEEGKTDSDSGVEYNPNSKKITIDPEKAAASMNTYGADKKSAADWVKQATWEEVWHHGQHLNAEAHGKSLSGYYSAIPESAFPKDWKKQGKAARPGWEKLSDWQKKAEFERMVAQGEHTGTISEAFRKGIQKILAFLKKAYADGPEWLRNNIREIEERLGLKKAEGESDQPSEADLAHRRFQKSVNDEAAARLAEKDKRPPEQQSPGRYRMLRAKEVAPAKGLGIHEAIQDHGKQWTAEHKLITERALKKGLPISLEAADLHGLKIPKSWTVEGDVASPPAKAGVPEMRERIPSEDASKFDLTEINRKYREKNGLGEYADKTKTKPPEPKTWTALQIKGEDAKPFVDFAKSIKPEDIYHEGSPDEYGIETEPHITALYGLDTQEPADVQKVIKNFGPVTAKIGGISLFENPGKPYDVVKASVFGPDVVRLNNALQKLPNSSDFPDYTPHVTLAYVKKGEGKKYVGKAPFTGKAVTFDSLHFKNAAKEITNLPLQTDKEPAKSGASAPVEGAAGDSKIDNPGTLHTAGKIAVTAPKGASFLRATDAKGRVSIEPLTGPHRITLGANPFQNAGPFSKVEAGVMGGKSRKEFLPIPGELKIQPAGAIGATKPDGSQHFKNDMFAQGAWLAKQALEKGSKFSELPEDKKLALMEKWRQLYPDANAAAKAFPIPPEFLSGNSFDAGLHGSEDARRSLAAYEERSGRKATAGSVEAFRAAAQPLIAASEKAGRVFSPKLLGLVGAQGGEHQVTFTPGRVLKITEPDSAGGVVKFNAEGRPGVFHGTLPEYLQQIETNRGIADDDMRVEGIMRHPDGGISIVSSQKAAHGVEPTHEEIAESMKESGFVPVAMEEKIGQEGDETWWNPSEGIAIMDAKPANLVKGDKGDINAIDIKAFKPTGKALEWIKKATKDSGLEPETGIIPPAEEKRQDALTEKNKARLEKVTDGDQLSKIAADAGLRRPKQDARARLLTEVHPDDLRDALDKAAPPESLGAANSEWPGAPVTKNPDGTPRTFYHGSSNAEALSKSGMFDASKQNPKSLYGPGFYFTDDPATAGGDGETVKGYAKKGEAKLGDAASPGVVPAHLDVRNPFDVDEELPDDKWKALVSKAASLMPEFDWDYISEKLDQREQESNIDGWAVYTALSKAIGEEDGKPLGKARANDLLQKMGYDGIAHIGGQNTGNKPHQVVIAFKPEQIFGKYGGEERKKTDARLFAAKPNPSKPNPAALKLAEATGLEYLGKSPSAGGHQFRDPKTGAVATVPELKSGAQVRDFMERANRMVPKGVAKPSAYTQAYNDGVKEGEKWDNDLVRFKNAAKYGDAEWPDYMAEPATVRGLHWIAGFEGRPEPRRVQAVRIGDVPKSGRSFNHRDQEFEEGVSALYVVGEKRSDVGTFDKFNDGKRTLIEGYLHHNRGADGEPLIVGAQKIRDLKEGEVPEKEEARAVSSAGFGGTSGVKDDTDGSHVTVSIRSPEMEDRNVAESGAGGNKNIQALAAANRTPHEIEPADSTPAEKQQIRDAYAKVEAAYPAPGAKSFHMRISDVMKEVGWPLNDASKAKLIGMARDGMIDLSAGDWSANNTHPERQAWGIWTPAVTGQPNLLMKVNEGALGAAKPQSPAERRLAELNAKKKLTPAEVAEKAALQQVVNAPKPAPVPAAAPPSGNDPFSKVMDEDIRPTLEKLGVGLKETLKGAVNFLAPTHGVAEPTKDLFFGMKGDMDEAAFIVGKTLEGMDKAAGKMSLAQNIEAMDRAKRGEKQASKALDDARQFMTDVEDKWEADLAAEGIKIAHKQNHYRAMWKVIPGSDNNPEGDDERLPAGVSRRPIRGSQGMRKHATLPDVSTGLAMGGVLHDANFFRNFKLAYADAMRLLAATRMWNGGKRAGLVKFLKKGEKMPLGFADLNDYIAKVQFKAESGEGMIEAGKWVGEEGFARMFNNYVSRDRIRESALGSGMMWVKNATTGAELSFSPFHAVFESLESVGSQIGLAIQQIFNRGFLHGDTAAAKSGMINFLTSPASPYMTAAIGEKAMRSAYEKDFYNSDEGKAFLKQFPDAPKMLHEMFQAGMKLDSVDGINNTKHAFADNLQSGNWIGAAIRALPTLSEFLMHPLFNVFIPRLKVGVFMKEYANALAESDKDITSGKKTRSQVAREIVRTVEDRFGEMNFDNFFWDRTLKSAAQLTFRSVTWKTGSVNQFWNAMRGQAEEFKRAYRERRAPILHRNFAWLLGMATLTAALGSIIQKMFTGKDPENLTDLVFPQIDKGDAKIRVSLPTYFKDLVHLKHSPSGLVTSSFASWMGGIADLWRNSDYYGVKIRNEDDPMLKQALDMAKHEGASLLPFSVRGYKRMSDEDVGQLRKILALGAMTPAPRYISDTPAETLARKYATDQAPIGGRTQEQADKSHARYLLEKQIRGGQTPQFGQEIAAGHIKAKDIPAIQRQARLTPLQALTKGLPIDRFQRVYDDGTPGEKSQLRAMLERKKANAEK